MRQMNILIQVGAMLVVHPNNNGVCGAFETTEKIHILEFPGWLGKWYLFKIWKKKVFVNKTHSCNLDVQGSTRVRIYLPPQKLKRARPARISIATPTSRQEFSLGLGCARPLQYCMRALVDNMRA